MNVPVSLRDFRDEDDPAKLGFPPSLPVEIALKTATPERLREEYGYSHSEWVALREDPVFVKALIEAVKMVQQEGMSFKLKARLQAEELLKRSWILIHDKAVPASVQSDLIKATMRWAGYDEKKEAGPGGSTNALQININL